MTWPKLIRPADVPKLCPAIRPRTLRYWIAQAKPKRCSGGGREVVIPGNGLEAAIIRKGRVVLLDEAKFLEWLTKSEVMS